MRKLLPLIVVLLCLTSCRKQSSDVPKRYAFPRIETCDSTMKQVAVDGVRFDINAAADTAAPRPGWLDITYPRYGVTVHLSVNKAADENAFMEALANRNQRISLNFGDVHAKAETFTNANGFECNIVKSPEAGSAPILFVAFDKNMRIVSGAAVFAGPTQPVDSIYPVYNAVSGDITRLLLSLQ